MPHYRDAVLPARRLTGAPATDLEALTRSPALPSWVSRWCARRRIRVHPRQIEPATPPWAPLRLLNALDRLPDRMVLIDRAVAACPDTATVVAAIDELPQDQNVLAAAIECATELDATLVLAHAVPLSFGERSVGLAEAESRGTDLLHRAAEQASAEAPWLTITTRQVRTHPHELVSGHLEADLLVLGRPSHPRDTGHGLVALSALTSGSCPLLLVPTGPAS
jgi:universal stress protein family protein